MIDEQKIEMKLSREKMNKKLAEPWERRKAILKQMDRPGEKVKTKKPPFMPN
jgi:hypothetical protein